MAQCPGCGVSYCLDCEESVDPQVFRCEPCRVAHDAQDPFACHARELAQILALVDKQVEKWRQAALASETVGHTIYCKAHLSQKPCDCNMNKKAELYEEARSLDKKVREYEEKEGLHARRDS